MYYLELLEIVLSTSPDVFYVIHFMQWIYFTLWNFTDYILFLNPNAFDLAPCEAQAPTLVI
jgi:hypothetical protein